MSSSFINLTNHTPITIFQEIITLRWDKQGQNILPRNRYGVDMFYFPNTPLNGEIFDGFEFAFFTHIAYHRKVKGLVIGRQMNKVAFKVPALSYAFFIQFATTYATMITPGHPDYIPLCTKHISKPCNTMKKTPMRKFESLSSTVSF